MSEYIDLPAIAAASKKSRSYHELHVLPGVYDVQYYASSALEL